MYVCVSMAHGNEDGPYDKICVYVYTILVIIIVSNSVVMENSWNFHFCFNFVVLAVHYIVGGESFFPLKLSFTILFVNHCWCHCSFSFVYESLHLTKRTLNIYAHTCPECWRCTADNCINRFYIIQQKIPGRAKKRPIH